jgi:hypothetical protein
MELVIVRTFNNYFSANIMLTKLQASGIECYLKDEYTVTIDPILSNAIGGIKLVVKKKDEEEIRKILQEFDKEYMQAATCPNCGAHDFTYIAKPGVTNFVTAILTWLLSNYAIATDYVYRCGNCGYESSTLPDNE